jgi:hypothetical protein
VAVRLARAAEAVGWEAFLVWDHLGGEGASALRRAARWDGWLAPATSHDGTPTMAKSPERIAGMVATIRRHRTTTAPFEVAIDGYSEAAAPLHSRKHPRRWKRAGSGTYAASSYSSSIEG